MNLICCAIWGDGGTTGPWTFMNWVKSVSRLDSLDTRKIVFVRDPAPGIEDQIHSFGVETIPWSLPPDATRFGKHDCQTHRWPAILAHLATHNYGAVIVTDGTDVVIQDDPFPFLYSSPKPLVMSTQLVKVKDSELDWKWMKAYLGRRADSGRDMITLNFGCNAGRQPYFSRFHKELYQILKKCPDAMDQAPGTYLSYTSWKSHCYIPPLSEAWALNDAFWITPPDVINGIAYPLGSREPYKIVHFYPEAVAQRYNETIPNDRCKHCSHGVYAGRCYTCGKWQV